MNKNNKVYTKRTLFIMMAVILICSMTACDKKQKEKDRSKTDIKEMVYEGTNLELKGIEGKISRFFVRKEKLYVLTDMGIEKEKRLEGTVVIKMYVANMDGSDIKEIPLPKIEENESMNTLFIDSNGNIIYLLNSYDRNSGKSSCYMVKMNEQGKEQMREDLTNSLKLTKNSRVIKAVEDDKGKIAILTDQMVYVLDEKLQLLCQIKSDNSIDGGARTKDGTIICGYSNKDGAWIQTLDIERKKWGESYLLDLQYFRSPDWIIDGFEYDFYYKDDSGIYGYDMKTKKGTKLMDYMASDIEPDKTSHLIPFEKNKFLGSTYENKNTSLVVYNKVDSSDFAGKQTIILGGMYMYDSMKTAVAKFNRENEKYRIEIKDYSDEEEPWTKMNMDILAGAVPDIICLNNLPSDQYVAKGILEDLTPYFDKDSEINTSDILNPILEATKIDDKLYYVFPTFGVNTIIGKAKDVGNKSGWTFEDLKVLLDELDEKGGKVRPFYSEGKSEMLYSFLTNSISDFVDWQTGECTFDSQEFKDILELCDRGKNDEEKGYGEDGPSMPSLIREGKILFAEDTVTLEAMQLYKKMFNEDIAFIGYPNKDREGSYFMFLNSLGIYSKSKMKDGAWEFLRMFMTKEYQSQSDIYFNVPTSIIKNK